MDKNNAQYAGFRTPVDTYTTGQQVASNCNSITFVNGGTGTMFIDDIPYFPGSSLNIPGNIGEFTDQVFNLRFAPGATETVCYVYRKIYN